MTRVQFDWLTTLVREGRPISSLELNDISGAPTVGSYSVRMQALVRTGMVYRPWHGCYAISERGKIAYALQAGINARRAAKRARQKPHDSPVHAG